MQIKRVPAYDTTNSERIIGNVQQPNRTFCCNKVQFVLQQVHQYNTKRRLRCSATKLCDIRTGPPVKQPHARTALHARPASREALLVPCVPTSPTGWEWRVVIRAEGFECGNVS